MFARWSFGGQPSPRVALVAGWFGQSAAEGVEDGGVGGGVLVKRLPDEFESGPALQQDAVAGFGGEGGELQDQRQEVRQLRLGRFVSGLAEGVFEGEQGHAAGAGVAVPVVGQVQAAAAGVVEGVDVLLGGPGGGQAQQVVAGGGEPTLTVNGE